MIPTVIKGTFLDYGILRSLESLALAAWTWGFRVEKWESNVEACGIGTRELRFWGLGISSLRPSACSSARHPNPGRGRASSTQDLLKSTYEKVVFETPSSKVRTYGQGMILEGSYFSAWGSQNPVVNIQPVEKRRT